MSFDLEDDWVWDFWLVLDDVTDLHHLFYLHAPRSLGDPELRHFSARVGHAVSADLRSWTPVAAPFPAQEVFDDLASWTGCTVRGPREWWMFTTGLSRSDDGLVQRIGAATSPDLEHWTRTGLLLSADPASYRLSGESSPDEAWRDPWVVRDDEGRWHMYVTARAAAGERGCGVVGHAVSEDLVAWEVLPPLSDPTGRFDWLEVISLAKVEGRWALLFSCLSPEMPGATPGEGGIWSVAVEGPGARVDVAAAVRLTDESSYVGKVVHHRGSAYFLAFRNQGPDGAFVGGVSDPVPVRWRADGAGLEVGEGRAGDC